MKRSAEHVFAPDGPRPLPWSARDVIAALTPVTLPERVARIERAVAARITSVVCVVESLVDPHNASAILRTCDGLGVHEVDVIEPDVRVLMNTRVTKGCEKWMDLRRHTSATDCASALRARGFALFVADMRATRSLDEIAGEPAIALAFGNEHAGISTALRSAADGAFAVPMRGMVESFNVSVAAAIALARVTAGRGGGDLSAANAEELTARYLLESVREAELVVERYIRDRATATSG